MLMVKAFHGYIYWLIEYIISNIPFVTISYLQNFSSMAYTGFLISSNHFLVSEQSYNFSFVFISGILLSLPIFHYPMLMNYRVSSGESCCLPYSYLLYFYIDLCSTGRNLLSLSPLEDICFALIVDFISWKCTPGDQFTLEFWECILIVSWTFWPLGMEGPQQNQSWAWWSVSQCGHWWEEM